MTSASIRASSGQRLTELEMSMRKRWLGLCAAVSVAFALTFVVIPAASAQVTPLLPNLKPFPALDLSLVSNLSTGGREIRFSTRSWNNGTGPLELRAGQADSTGQQVDQRVYNSDGTHTDYFVGKFVWHPEHNHFHFENYAIYYLEPINAPGGSVKSGTKTTFCVMDTNKIDGSLPGAPLNAGYPTCGNTIQGMSVGWADTYGSHLAGQSVDFTGNPSGDYCLTIMVDPKGRLVESNENDNISETMIHVDVERLSVTVLSTTGCTPAGGTVAVAGVSPNTGTTGTAVPVVITGSGFASGMAITFEGGSGPPPTVTNPIVSSDGTRISGSVTIKKGKPGKDAVWDLRVGSGVLFNSFTVTR
jgi:hypothetical protein